MDDERVDVEGLPEDDSLDLTPGESYVDHSSSLLSDEPVQLVVSEDLPMIDQEAPEVENDRMDDHIVEQQPQHEDVHPSETVSRQEKSLDGSQFSGDKLDDVVTSSKPADVDKVLIDTSAPIESVKDAVSKFGGLVNRKAYKTQDNKSGITEHELEKARDEIPLFKLQNEAAEEAKMQALKELEATNRLIEELKLNLESAEAEELHAKQDSELAKLRVKEMMEEQGIVDEGSVSELKCVREEVEDLQKEYASLLIEKESALKRAQEALSETKEIEKTVEEMSLELVSTKETLVYARLESEDKRNGSVMDTEQGTPAWDNELKHAEEDMEKLNQQVEMEKELKRKLHSASDMLASLKYELATYRELKIQDSENKRDNEMQGGLDELKVKTEKARDEVQCLKGVCLALQKEVDHEKEELASVKQREGMVDVGSLEAELENVKSEIIAVRKREKEAKDKMVELPKQIEIASREAEEAKSCAESARARVRKVKEEVEKAKVKVTTVEKQLLTLQREIEAAKDSEKLAMGAIKQVESNEEVTISLEDYNELNKRAQEADEKAIAMMTDIMAQVEAAREAEKETLSKLEEANQELLTRKEVYEHANNKAQKENQAKMVVEQEFRKWSDENQERPKLGDNPSENKDGQEPLVSHEQEQGMNKFEEPTKATPSHVKTASKDLTESDSSNSSSPRSPAGKKKKKKHFFPHFFMMFSKKKTSSNT